MLCACDWFTNILQSYFTYTCPSACEAVLKDMGRIVQYLTSVYLGSFIPSGYTPFLWFLSFMASQVTINSMVCSTGKKTSKLRISGQLWRESNVIPIAKGQQCRKHCHQGFLYTCNICPCYHVMMSSCTAFLFCRLARKGREKLH